MYCINNHQALNLRLEKKHRVKNLTEVPKENIVYILKKNGTFPYQHNGWQQNLVFSLHSLVQCLSTSGPWPISKP